MVPPNTCAACSATVAPEELAQGLAVKVDGRLLCPLCLDRLPGNAQVMVNQMRALRGMAVTTYRYFSGRHPGLPLYTFTTAGLILGHRHKLVHGESFEAPPLPPPGSRPRLPSAAEAGRGERSGWITVAGVAVLLVSGLIWLALPSSPAKPPPLQPPPIAADPPPTVPVVTSPPQRNPALELTDLARLLRAKPAEAQAVADAAEILRDGLPPGDLALRSRADTLWREALAVVEAQRPKPLLEPTPAPLPEPPPVQQLPQPEPVPVQQPEPPKPDLAPIADPLPVPTIPAVEPIKPVKPAKAEQAVACDVEVLLPKPAKPLIESRGLPPKNVLVPWPWPSGVPIYAPALDRKKKLLAIEMRLPGVGINGGATIVVHPGKLDRKQLIATWHDDATATASQTLVFDGLRWQSLAIPATGTAALVTGPLRLRLEDEPGLDDSRPFLVAGAHTLSSRPPVPADSKPALPIVLPPSFDNASGWSTFRKKRLSTLTGTRFLFAKAKVLLPKIKDCRTAVRKELTTLLKDDPPDGNPDELPTSHPDFANVNASWPADGMGNLSEYPALVFGWRTTAWGAEGDLGIRLDKLINKMLVAKKTPRRPAVIPVLVIGDMGFATADERKAIDRIWLDQALRLAGDGFPVIDVREAQSAVGADQIESRAAMLLADGLRQLDWMINLK